MCPFLYIAPRLKQKDSVASKIIDDIPQEFLYIGKHFDEKNLSSIYLFFVSLPKKNNANLSSIDMRFFLIINPYKPEWA